MSNKMFSFLAAIVCAAVISMSVCHAEVRSSRVETSLKDGWRFHRGEADGAFIPAYDDSGWDKVSVPHDWAITGPFSIENDLQNVQIVQNMETKASLKTGRTGGLPYVGIGWYRTEFSVPDGMTAELLFDGAMSEARSGPPTSRSISHAATLASSSTMMYSCLTFTRHIATASLRISLLM